MDQLVNSCTNVRLAHRYNPVNFSLLHVTDHAIYRSTRRKASGKEKSSLTLQLILSDIPCLLEELLLLLDMACLQSRGHAGTWVSSSIHNVSSVVMLGCIQQCLNSWLDKTPCSCIQRFLLTPYNRLRVGIRIEVLLQLLPRERIQLFNTSDGGVLVPLSFTMLVKSGVHLTGTKDHTVNLFMGSDEVAVLGIGNDPAKVGVAREIFNVGSAERVSEERLGEKDTECCCTLVSI